MIKKYLARKHDVSGNVGLLQDVVHGTKSWTEVNVDSLSWKQS